MAIKILTLLFFEKSKKKTQMSFVAKIRSGDGVEKVKFRHDECTPYPFSLTVPNKGDVTLMVHQKGNDKLVVPLDHGRHTHQNEDFTIQGKLVKGEKAHT